MIREMARPNALSRVNMETAMEQLWPEQSPLRRHFITITNQGNEISLWSNLIEPRTVRVPFLTQNNEVITTDSFTKEGERIELIRVFNKDTQEMEAFRSPAFFWIYSKEEEFDLGRLSQVGYNQAIRHVRGIKGNKKAKPQNLTERNDEQRESDKGMYANVNNLRQVWVSITCYPDDRETLVINSNMDSRYPVATKGGFTTSQGQVIKRHGDNILIDGKSVTSPYFGWIYQETEEPIWDFDSIYHEAEKISWDRYQQKMDEHRDWHISDTFTHLEETEDAYYKHLEQGQEYDYYRSDYTLSPTGDVLQTVENTSIIPFEDEANFATAKYIQRTINASLYQKQLTFNEAETIRKHIHNLVGNDQEMVNLMVRGLKGEVIFPDKTPERISRSELRKLNCQWIYHLSEELFKLQENSEDIRLTNHEEYEHAMRDITDILAFPQEQEYANLVREMSQIEEYEGDGVQIMFGPKRIYPAEAPERVEPKELEMEDEDPSVPSVIYSKIDENDWAETTKRTGRLKRQGNETYIEYETLPEYKYTI